MTELYLDGNVVAGEYSPEQSLGILKKSLAYCKNKCILPKSVLAAGFLAAEELGRHAYRVLHTCGYTEQTHTYTGVEGLTAMVLGALFAPSAIREENRDARTIRAAAVLGSVVGLCVFHLGMPLERLIN